MFLFISLSSSLFISLAIPLFISVFIPLFTSLSFSYCFSYLSLSPMVDPKPTQTALMFGGDHGECLCTMYESDLGP